MLQDAGVHYEVDCIIYASGFEVGTAFSRRAGFDPIGRDGLNPAARSAWRSAITTPCAGAPGSSGSCRRMRR